MKISELGRYGISALCAGLLLACGGGGDTGGGGAAGGGDTGGGGAPAMTSPVDAATAGNISGRVLFEGMAPEAAAIDMSSEDTCASQYPGGAMAEDVAVNADGSLANVFVYVKSGLGDLQFPAPAEDVVLDQQGCRYHPHILGLQANQNLVIRNSDGILHNINATPSVNRPFNLNQPMSMDSPARQFAMQEIMIPVRCDVHGWMQGFIGVVSNPYFAVTGDGGSFDLSTLPPGEYVVEAWHERFGVMEQTVTVATGETAQVEFTFSAEMAENAVVPMAEPLIIHHGENGEPIPVRGDEADHTHGTPGSN